EAREFGGVSMQIGEAIRNLFALGVVPRTAADAVARVDGGLTIPKAGAEVGMPGFIPAACRGGKRLADSIGSGRTAEIGSFARTGAGNEKAHRLRRRLLRRRLLRER